MKEKIGISVFVIIITTLEIFLFRPNKVIKKNIFEPNFSFPFYKEEKKDEYIKYQNENNITIKDAIIQVNIGLNNPFYTHTKLAKDEGIHTLINKYHYISKDYIPPNLIKVNNLYINEEAYKSFIDMRNDMNKENLIIRIISAYRSYDYQEELYSRYLKNDRQELVDSYSARPGFSEHHTGLAIDIDNIKYSYNEFYLTKEFEWMQNNAYKYGFILRYPKDKEKITGYKYEPWHYRYVGKDIASYIKKNNLTYEEYYYEFIDNE